MKTFLGTAEIKARLSEMITRVATRDERLVVLRRGKPIAALVGLADLHRLEAADEAERTRDSGDHHPIMRAFGGWAQRDDLDELVAEIYADRWASSGREVEL